MREGQSHESTYPGARYAVRQHYRIERVAIVNVTLAPLSCALKIWVGQAGVDERVVGYGGSGSP